MNVDVSINSGLNVEAVFSGNDIAVEVAFAEPLKVDVEILAGTKGIKGDSMFQQVGTEIKPVDENATLDASFIANLPEIDNEVTKLSTNPVKSSGIWDALQSLWVACSTALGLHLDATADAHPSSAISHGSGSVEDRLENITDGVITKDANDDILSMMTLGETTVFNRDANGDIESWENATHIWTLTKISGEISGWTLTDKP